MKKIIISIISLFAILMLSSVGSTVKATTIELCNQETEYIKWFDYDDFRVNINFQESDHAITVAAKTGYELVSAQLDVDDDGHVGYFTYSIVDNVKFNPNPGHEINAAKIKVAKVCDLCTNIEGVQRTIPAGYEVLSGDGVCTLIPVDVCPNIEKVQTEIPEGMIKNDKGDCVEIVNEKDLCPNIDGAQLTVPNHYFIDNEGNCSRMADRKKKVAITPEVLGTTAPTATAAVVEPEKLPVGGGDFLSVILSLSIALVMIAISAIAFESLKLFPKSVNEKK